MILHAYPGESTHHLKDGRIRRFRPKGEMFVCLPDGRTLGNKERKENPIDRISGGGYSARIFIGLNVGDKATHTIDDVVKATIAIRQSQKALPDASFLAQRGVYTEDRSGQIVVEESVQVIIIDMAGLDKEAFTKQMETLAEKLRAKFEQESVILEIQHRGVAQDVYSVRA